MIPAITVNLDKPCAECRRDGAMDSGICMGCTAKAMAGKPMKSETGQLVALRCKHILERGRAAFAEARTQAHKGSSS